MTFPQSVAKLMQAAFDGYLVDLRRGARTFYIPDSESLDLSTAKTTQNVASRFDAESIRAGSVRLRL
jgi:N-formylglutamate amidohydrolase